MINRAIKDCPNCGEPDIYYDGIKKFHCNNCSWEFYHNTAASVAGIIEYDGYILAVERNCEPGKGMLDFPGGFVDPMETAEDALIREIKEELGVNLKNICYLCTAPNEYKYKGIHYSTCDIFFTAEFTTNKFDVDTNEISDCRWLLPSELKADDFAFSSMKQGIEVLKRKKFEMGT